MSYLTGLAFALSRLKRSIPISVLKRIYCWLGFVLVGLSCMFLFGCARIWLLKQNGWEGAAAVCGLGRPA